MKQLVRGRLLRLFRLGTSPTLRPRLGAGGWGLEQLEDRSVPAVYYVGNDTPADFTITNDVAPPGLSNGDTVTWNPTGGQHPAGAVSGLIFGTNAFTSIQSAVNAAAPGDTIDIEGGTYAENVTVDTPLTLIGANPTNPVPGRTGPEAVVEPGLTSSYDTDSIFTVTANNVTIEGFTIQGSITGTPPNGQSAGLTLTSGTTVYAAAAISNSTNVNTGGSAPSTTDISGLTVQDNILQDFTQVGVYGDTSDGLTSTGNTISDNLITDLPNNGQGGYFGIGVLIYDNFYAAITGNSITQARTGIETGNNYLSAGAFAPSISDNAVSASVKGVYFNLQYGSASAFTIDNNTITQDDLTVSPEYNVGLLVQSIQGSVTSTIQGNVVSGFLYGVEFAGNDTTSTVTLQGGTLTDNTYGVWATNNDYFYPASYNTTATISGVTITNSTAAGVWIDSTSPNSVGQSDTTDSVSLAFGGGTTVTSGTTGVLIDSPLSLITGNTLSATTFSGQTGNDITLTNGALAGMTLDATGVTFDGQTGATATLAQAFAIEDKISDLIDTPGLGFVQIKANTVFVTQLSEDTTVGAIQRAVNVAAAGDTINVQAGTYPENVTVSQSVTLIGANTANPVPGRTGPETVIEPGLTSSYDTDSVFTVTANNVTIEGFTIQGSITGTPSSGQSAGFTLTSGTTVYAAAAISNSTNVNTGGSAPSTTDISGLTVQDNILQDFTQVGVYGDTSDGVASTGNIISDNLISDLPENGQGGYIGIGVFVVDNFYAAVAGNKLTDVRTGIQADSNYVSAGAFAPSISDNAVSASVKGIYLNNQYESASGYTVSDNTISQDDPTVSPAYNVGLLVQSIQNAVAVTLQGNAASGFLYGVEFAGNDTTSTVTLQGGTLTDNTYGVWATNNDYNYPSSYDTAAALSGVTIANSTTAGVWIDSISPNSMGQSDTTDSVSLAFGGGTTITGGAVGVLVQGGLSLVTGDTLGNTALTGQTGNYITLANGALVGKTLDATGVSFGGQAGATATLAQAFAIEDKISDLIDTPGLGFVQIKANTVFVTQLSEDTTVGAIQRAVNVAAAGDTINVQAGTYPENVTVSQSVTLIGANTANPVPGRTGPETVIEPGLTSSYDTDSIFTVTANNVTIEGFTIQGSITGTPPNGQSAGFTLTSGTTVYAAAAISNSTNVNTGGSAPSTTDISGLTVQDNILQDFTQVGVYGDTSDGVASTGNTIADNVITDLPNNGQGGYIGIGVFVVDNFYAAVTGNKLTDVRTGIQADSNYASAGSFTPSISDNAVSASVKGIYVNNQYGGATGYTVSDNTISQDDPSVSPAYNVGLIVQSIQNAVAVTLQGNTATGFLYGVEFAGNDTLNTVTLQGGTLANNTYGVWATNNDYNYPSSYDTAAALSGVTIANSTTAGVWIDSISPNSMGQSDTTDSVSLGIGGGTTVTGGPTGLLVSGSLSLITGNTLTNTSFSGQSGDYITLSAGALAGVTIDATGVSFDGLTGATATLAQNFTIEDKILHAVDAATLGFIRVKAGNVFVTPNSFAAADGTTTPSVQRGVNVASAGDTVNIEGGTYPEAPSISKSLNLLASGVVTVNSLTATAAIGLSGPFATSAAAGFSFAQPVTLTGTTSLTTAAAGPVGFSSTVDGGFGLTITAAGNTTFGGAVGSTTPLASLAVTTTGLTAGAVATTGGITITNSAAGTIGGAITGTGSGATFTKQGAGTLTLTGTNSYQGVTTVGGGTLLVNGNDAAATAPVKVITGGTLGGTGTVSAIDATGGTVSPGLVGSVGTLSTAATSAGSSLNGATFQVDVTNPAASDQLAIGSGATVDLTGATLSVDVLGAATGNTYTIVSSPTGGISGTFTGLSNTTTFETAGRVFQINYTPTAVTLTTPVSPVVTTASSVLATVSAAAQSIGLSATVTSPDGVVNEGTETFTILSGTTVIGSPVTVNVVMGAADASYVLPGGTLTGTYTIQATYNGTTNFAGATDTSHTLTIQATVYSQIAVGAITGSSVVTVYNADGSVDYTVDPFPGSNGAQAAIGDFNGDGVPDLAVGTGPGVTAEVEILDGTTHAVLFEVQPFGTFTGGVFVAAGEITGDGIDDLVISPDQGGGPRIEVYQGGSFTEIANFFGIPDSGFRGGARVAVGDITGDGHADLVVSAGVGGGPRIDVFSGAAILQGQPIVPVMNFFAFPDQLRNGTYVAVGDVNGDGKDDIIIGAGPGGGPQVLVINGQSLMADGAVAAVSNPIASFYVGNSTNRGGVTVAAKNLDNDQYADVVTGSGAGDGSQVTEYSGVNLAVGSATPGLSFDAFPGSMGGVYVG